MNNKPQFSDLLCSPTLFLAFGFGSGLSPKAPGTIGTVAAIPIWLLLADLSAPLYWGLLLTAIITGIAICGNAAKKLGVHDHPGIVWDEFVGFWIAMPFMPSQGWWLLWGFLLFRFFDIVKPWPIGWLDKRVHGGLGIMLDDIVAGLFAAAVGVCVGYW